MANKDMSFGSDSDLYLSVFFGAGTVFYIFVFTATWLFTVPQTPINDRLLMPIYFTTLLWMLSSWAIWQRAWFSSLKTPAWIIPWFLAAIMVYWYYPQLIGVVEQSYKNDTVTAYRWRDSQIIQAVKNLPADQLVISNKSETVAMWADRPAYDLMENLHPGFLRETSSYGTDGTDSAQQVFRQGAVLVVFNDFKSQFESTYGDRGKERLMTIFQGLTILKQYPDGVIYIYSGR